MTKNVSMTTNRRRLAWLAILAMMLFLAACRERSPEAALDTPATPEAVLRATGVLQA